MSKRAIQINNAPAPVGPYSQGILQNNLLFISGQIPMNPQTNELEVSSIEDATQQVMLNIKALLEAAEMKMTDVIKCSIFLADLNDFNKVNEIYASYFSGVYPARETVQVSKLPLNVPIEISCIAVRND
jgi:2-iminobutanoate/2-iminopropanoate deaminase